MPAQPIDVSGQQVVQRWGNGLAVRLTGPIAKAARLTQGQPVTVQVVDGAVLLRPAGKPRLTLAQKLRLYDPAIHGGQFVDDAPVGREMF